MPSTKTPHPDAIIFGEVFRQLRLQRGWTLRACAQYLDISASHLGILESGYNMPSVHLLLRFAKVFDVHAWEIFRSFEEKRSARFTAVPLKDARSERG